MIVVLTLTTDVKVYINLDTIKYFHESCGEGKTSIFFTNDDYLEVKEKPEYILGLARGRGKD